MIQNLNYITTIFIMTVTLSLKAQTDTIIAHQLDEIVIKGKIILDKLSDSEIDSSTIERFTYHQPYDVYTLAPGILRRGRDIIVRGGNRNDIDWQIEGVSVRDPQTSGYIISTNMNAIGSIKFSPGGLIANVGNARGGIIDLSLKEPEANYSSASLMLGTYNTRIIDGIISRNFGKFKFIFSNSLMTSDAISLDSRVPIDYNPYTKVLNSDEIYPTEQNRGVRLNITTKAIYQMNEKTKYSFVANYSFEQADNPPLYHNGINFTPVDIQNLIANNKIDSSDYSHYPYNKNWGGIINNSGTLLIVKMEKLINNKSSFDVSPFLYCTYKNRNDHDGSWFFEQGFGGDYENTRNNYQYGVKSNYFNQLTNWYNIKLSTEFRLTDINYSGSMNPTVIDTYGNIRRNFYKDAPYTNSSIRDPSSPYYNWPNPQSIISPLKEKYDGNYYYFVTLFNNNFKFNDFLYFNFGLKNTTTNIGKNVSIFDPFATIKLNFLEHFILSAGYSHATQITSIYQSFSNPYDPYTYGYEASFDAEGNPNIKPERAKMYEIGIGYETRDISIGLTYYQRKTSDDILTNYAPEIVPVTIDTNIAKHYLQYQNLGDGKANGLELRLIVNFIRNFKISVFGNLFAEAKTRPNNTGVYEYTRYNQKNTLNILFFYKSKNFTTQLQMEYGSGLPFRWREMGVDQNGNPIQIRRHNYDKNVDPHLVFNGSLDYKIVSDFSICISLMNIQGLLDPIFQWGKNQYIEYRDNDSIQNPNGVPRYAFYSISRINFGVKYGF